MPNARQTSLIASPSSSRATNRRRSSITEHSFHGIDTSPGKGKGVTHVSGTICHLCLGPLTAANLPQPGPAIRRAVSFLLRHAPSHLHLVLTTRLEPPLSLGGLLAKNRLLGVDASVLRFDYSFASRSRLVALAF